MKRFAPFFAAFLLLFLLTSGMTCTPGQQRTTYTTIYSLEDGTANAYQAYMTLVLQNKIPTNAVPKISDDFRVFQVAAQTAIELARGNTNAAPTGDMAAKSVALIGEINTEKMKAGVR